MELEKLVKITKNLSEYNVEDVYYLEFMNENELNSYQNELEVDAGNLSEWEHLRAFLTLKNEILELKEQLKGE